MDEKALERFLEKVHVDPNGGCWLWDAHCTHAGYSTFKLEGRKREAHRVAYEHYVGPIPEGLHLDHLCRVRCCVNPSHLEPVTTQENTRRGLPGNQGRMQRERTHCPEGHEYTPENTYMEKHKRGGPHRKCRTCKLRMNRAYQARKKAEMEGSV